MKKFQDPELTLILLTGYEIITTSGDVGDDEPIEDTL